MKNVIIIGGGIIGLSCAFYLKNEGHQVIIIDQSDISSGASFVNAGYISPSHVIPLSAPGMVSDGLKMMFNSSSPFYLKPRLDLDLFKWAWNFNKNATEKHVIKSIPIIKDLSFFSKALYLEIKKANIFDFQFEQKGVLMSYQSSKFEKKEAYLAKMAKEQGLEVHHIDKKRLEEIEPEMKAEGAYHYLCDAHSTPDIFMRNFKEYLKSKGVQFHKNEKVLNFVKNGKKVSKLITNKQEYNLDELVIAAGSWSPIVAKKLNIPLLVQAGKGYRINVVKNTSINFPAILTDRNVAVTPMDGFTRFGGTMEIAGINNHINQKRVQAIANAGKAFYPNLTFSQEEKQDAASGLRPVSPDGLPYIGRTKKYNNVCIATGHAMMGWSQGPATGKLISEVISNKKTFINLVPFSIERFN
ncbi:FAD-dependent oxidoreductase [Lutibacter sp.]|uniref:NAD(P)/FAD-dependent oxidoreductase n=1 Tax=Lutibacter sp. TaxID=1925666 RepID=UPI0025B8F98A|nr:FAD-dependent oxidoreductase [Lutibacter sp.]MCF6181621.1 FAD-dependent oxidoreductase [Lutibacter sp.]